MSALGLAAAWVVVVVGLGRVQRPCRRTATLVSMERRGGTPSDGSHRSATRTRFGRRGLIALPAAALGLLLGPIGAAGTVGVALVVRRLWAVRSVRRLREAQRDALADGIDLLVVAIAAGTTARHGLRLIAERGPPPLRAPFARVVAHLDAGEPMAAALGRLVGLLGEPARPLVRALTVAERDGTSVRALLDRLSDDARRQRRHELEASIRRLPIRLSFPLVCCVLPAFAVLTVVPLLASGLQRLGPIGP